MIIRRGVAQPGSAPAWGAGGRVFESLRPDHFPRAGQPQRASTPHRAVPVLSVGNCQAAQFSARSTNELL